MPVLVEVRIDRRTDAAMGISIDKIVERDPVIDLPQGTPVGTRPTVGAGKGKK